jgi:Na+/H+ antiporter NhaA
VCRPRIYNVQLNPTQKAANGTWNVPATMDVAVIIFCLWFMGHVIKNEIRVRFR